MVASAAVRRGRSVHVAGLPADVGLVGLHRPLEARHLALRERGPDAMPEFS